MNRRATQGDIGKKVYVTDNSYCISYNPKKQMPAGTIYNPKSDVFTIVSIPFELPVGIKGSLRPMVNVQDEEGDIISVFNHFEFI